MDTAKGYFDYCISEKCIENDFENVAKQLYEFGYRTIAINQTLHESSLTDATSENKKKKKLDKSDIVPPPIDIKIVKGCEQLKILNRLTIAFSNNEIINRVIKSANFKKYHVIAAQPETHQAFQYTCSSFEADIFTFNPDIKLNFKIARKLYNLLIEKGYHFEILYGPSIEDSTKRKNIIATAHMFHSYGKSRNIIISSGATNNYLIRSPYDIMNLGLLFGLSEGQARDAVQNNGRNVYIHAMGRRMGKTIMLIENLKDDNGVGEESESDEEMDLDQPVQKKSKQ